MQSNPLVKAVFLKNTLNVLDAITTCLNKRFSSFLASEIIGPSNWPMKQKDLLDISGNAEILKLMNHFDVVLKANDCLTDEINKEWQKLKLNIKSNHSKMKCNELWECIISQKSERYSNVLHIVKIILAVPISTSHVERLFSGINCILGEST